MYFSRYIWNYLQRVYLRRTKYTNFIQNISKLPSTKIPPVFHYTYKKNHIKSIKYNLLYLKYLNNSSINLSSINIYINKYFKYKYIHKYNYSINYDLNYFYNKHIKKYKFRRISYDLNLHNGRYYTLFKLYRLKKLKLTLGTLNETVTYGFKKKKKRKEKNKKKKS